MAEHLGAAGLPLISAADRAFVTAMHWAAGGSALVALLSIGVVLAFMPRRSGAQALEAPAPAARAAEPETAKESLPRVVIGAPKGVIEASRPEVHVGSRTGDEGPRDGE